MSPRFQQRWLQPWAGGRQRTRPKPFAACGCRCGSSCAAFARPVIALLSKTQDRARRGHLASIRAAAAARWRALASVGPWSSGASSSRSFCSARIAAPCRAGCPTSGLGLRCCACGSAACAFGVGRVIFERWTCACDSWPGEGAREGCPRPSSHAFDDSVVEGDRLACLSVRPAGDGVQVTAAAEERFGSLAQPKSMLRSVSKARS